MTAQIKLRVVLFTLITFSIIGNSIAGDKKFRKQKAIGIEYAQLGEFTTALEYLLRAEELKEDDAELQLYIGVSFLNSPFPTKALMHIARAEELGIQDPYLQYHYGRADHINHIFADAITHYENFLGQLDKSYEDEEAKRIETEELIQQCKNAIHLQSDSLYITVENLGETINTQYPEYVPVISADESVMFFTSRRPETTGGKKSKGDKEYFEDIFVSYRDNGEWTSPEPVSTNINSDDHDACIGVSPDGQKLFIYKANPKKELSGDIYISVKEGDEWDKPVKLGENINTDGWEPSASITKDGKTLFFTSNRPGGYGGTDIYMSRLSEAGTWLEAVNLGPKINTEKDEDAPFIHVDDKTLFFSSRGHNTIGGFDIFVSVLEDGEWREPYNIGYPINTASDNIYMVWNADMTKGYYSSFTTTGYGDKDLYVITRPKEDPEMVVLKGNVHDGNDSTFIGANIEITDIETGEIVGEYTANNIDGKYYVVLPHGRNYSVTVEKEGFLFYSKNVNIPLKEHYHEVTEDIYLQPIYEKPVASTTEENNKDESPHLATGSHIILNNIFYDYDKASLKKESKVELDHVAELMLSDENIYIEISGHTDNVASHKYNQILSEQRAFSVVQYLVDKGIDHDRLVAVGYGEEHPVVSNENEATRPFNRRTELMIIEAKDTSKYDNRVKQLNKQIKTGKGDIVRAQRKAEVFYYSTKTSAKPEVGQLLSLKIHFMFNNHDYITDFSKGQAKKVINLLEQYPDLRLMIHAHADPFGNDIYNQELSEKRAETVMAYLVEKGVDESRLVVSTYGEEKPLVDSDSKAENLVNRRVEFEVID